MIKCTILLFIALTFWQSGCSNKITTATRENKKSFCKDEVIAVMSKVCDWQLENLPDYIETSVSERRQINSRGWIRGAFFTGLMATYETTRDEKYLEAALKWAEGNKWQFGERGYHADDHCVGQTYAELYFIRKEPKMIAPMKTSFDTIIANPQRGPDIGWSKDKNWSWCDALFMAPPALARLSTATGERKYLDLMNMLWWDTTGHLYDKVEHLYYRDARFKIKPDGDGKLTRNGRKVFWSRGNGWVVGGLVRVLQHMPDSYPDRGKYECLLKEMAAKLASLQCEDGLWRSSLLDVEELPAPETSGSGFFCYALAWGINNGLLEKERYLPVVKKAWKGLVWAVQENGKLGWVQSVAASPGKVSRDDTMEYGVGAFLLAGSEVAKF